MGIGTSGQRTVKHRPPTGKREGIWVKHRDGSASFLGWVDHTEHRPGANVPLEIHLQNGSILSVVKWPLAARGSTLPLPAPPEDVVEPQPELAEQHDQAPAPSATEYSFHRSRS